MTPAASERIFSFEFFPAKTPEGMQKLQETRNQLAQLKPKFFSVTYGAGGSTQERTLEAAIDIQAHGCEAAPHLSCIGSTRETIRELLATYQQHGIRHTVALRGDLPSGTVDFGHFRFASDLVEFIRAETGDWFEIEVAAYPEVHPQARSARDDLLAFKRKAQAGADSAITQYFYNADAYFQFVEDCQREGVDIPIVPGIMPIGNFSQLVRFSEACGADIPRWLRMKMQSFGDDSASIRALGLDVVTNLCDRLLAGGAPGLHFFTMNRAGPTSTIWQRLGL
ncbi:MAG: methylenetetrahydrofolate reductase [NAD(P)H] [Betaproteobacteria bacterium]|jgi:methylenetetrahydrofolate reductase (NADPH)|nr:methylenetetrahydrofolate reductase [NAD(P)H] [Betaproteobacteria bacterium]NBT05731.1 methylenetetrahydrofolate reductase [NAD(P)H] [Betaproteobacteria bacterium]NBU12099.1 methylenetetrahydrofolate reductase [NAD(P)H] [Betaproteobacteria bacterium]NBY52232.1 methylenetetrahydrofolate reductase [NAD(P)H] [Betaproteobacteria bacterium]NCA23791.1 methylenetetrahydrofolate reductase [NAD(P)H] [Betaproteobacteria bacterium]